MKSFVMAHEIAHAVLGHVENLVATTDKEASERTVVESPYEQEFAADKFAFEALLRSEELLQPKYPVSTKARAGERI